MRDLINTEILQDIITDHSLCDVQKKELIKTIERLNIKQPIITIGIKKELSLLLMKNGIFSFRVPFGITLEQADKIAIKKESCFYSFDVDTYEVNNYGGMIQVDTQRYSKDKLDKISMELLKEYENK